MREDPEPHKLVLLPPAEGLCPECGARHEPEQPHDATSLYYQMEHLLRTGREATWADAARHCSPEVREAVRAAVAELGLEWE